MLSLILKVEVKDMADERWKYVVFNKSITEEESLDFYTTWAKDVSKPYGITGYGVSRPGIQN